MKLFRLILLLLAICFAGWSQAMAADLASQEQAKFPLSISAYAGDEPPGLGAKLLQRIRKEPLNGIATALFFCAIINTFLASRFSAISHWYQHEYENLEEHENDPESGPKYARLRDKLQFRAQVFQLLGEVEAVFGIWVIPLVMVIALTKGWQTTVQYLTGISYAEPVFVVVIMIMAASRPVLRLAEQLLALVAAIGKGSPAAWWLSILTVGPLLGSFVTEPAAMTICALLLRQHFYSLQPRFSLRYATLGLLFVNISVGGTLTHFAAPPVIMVAAPWSWGTAHMLGHFGWKAFLGILIANAVYFFAFQKELQLLGTRPRSKPVTERKVPGWITIVHVAFMGWTVMNAHYSALVVLGFLFYVAFISATERHQAPIDFRGPILVGCFLAALVIHGGGQQWWIAPVLNDLGRWPLMIGATALTVVNDNAAITYLASLVPDFSDPLKYAVVAGAVTGGGLTVIANAPNPAGQSILCSCFGEDGVSPGKLFLGALIPTLILGAAFMLLP